MSEAKFAIVDSQKVNQVYLDQVIGSGTVTSIVNRIAINTEFNWPPDAIALVAGLFDLAILSSDTCSVQASYPGLLKDPIDAPDASYFVLLILARAQINITTPSGAHLTFITTGPWNEPGVVTGYSLGIAEPGQPPISFTFPIV